MLSVKRIKQGKPPRGERQLFIRAPGNRPMVFFVSVQISLLPNQEQVYTWLKRARAARTLIYDGRLFAFAMAYRCTRVDPQRDPALGFSPCGVGLQCRGASCCPA